MPLLIFVLLHSLNLTTIYSPVGILILHFTSRYAPDAHVRIIHTDLSSFPGSLLSCAALTCTRRNNTIMDTAQPATNVVSRQRSFKTIDDVSSLTSFNPFSEEDEHDQSSYAIVTSLFSKVKNTLAAPLTSAVTSSTSIAQSNPPATKDDISPINTSSRPQPERPNSLVIVPSNPAPPLVFLTPVVSEAPSYNSEYDRPSSRGGLFYSPIESNEALYGTAIPGFPIADDARSIRTSGSANLRRTASVSKVIRRIRGEGASGYSCRI